MFIEDICPQSYADEDVWSSLAESGDSPIEFADNMFSDYDQEHRQRFLNVLSSGMTNS